MLASGCYGPQAMLFCCGWIGPQREAKQWRWRRARPAFVTRTSTCSLDSGRGAGGAASAAPAESARSVFDDLKSYLDRRRRGRPRVVHRIDRGISGLVVFAATAGAQARLKEQFARRVPERVYLAVVHGHPTPAAGVWRDHVVWDTRSLMQKPAASSDPRAKEAVCRYRIVERLAGASLIEVTLVTDDRIRSASRRCCTATRWPESSDIPPLRTQAEGRRHAGERLRSPGRRCMRTA